MADDEFALRKDMERAAQAQQALENPIIIEAFKVYEQRCWEAWKASPPRDTEGRERLHQAVMIIDTVKSHLQTVVANGQLSSAQIERDYFTPRKRFGIV